MRLIEQPAMSRHQSNHRAGFTLIEMLVVIGIIVLLIGLLAPMLSNVYKSSMRARMLGDMLVISSGLDAYRADFKDYPRVDYAGGGAGLQQPYGATLLAWALLSPGPGTQDGADGPGFRLHQNGGGPVSGQVYGPYIQPSRLKTGASPVVMLAAGVQPDDTNTVILDKYDHPYLYFPAFKNATITAPSGYVGDWTTGPAAGAPMYNHNDGAVPSSVTPSLILEDMKKALGDKSPFDGAITGSEQAAYTGPYILWGAGPDGEYGFPGMSAKTDDVFSFSAQ